MAYAQLCERSPPIAVALIYFPDLAPLSKRSGKVQGPKAIF